MDPSRLPLRIGTRGSPLARAQADLVRALLGRAHPTLAPEDAVVFRIIRTSGDAIQDRTLSALGGKGLFTKEIEAALLDGEIDLAVHSMKDMPTALPDGLVVSCLLPREDPRDVVITRDGVKFSDLPKGAVIGTASLRRQAQLLARRPDLQVVPFRGNVGTRLDKLKAGVVDATLLAAAGLNRLGFGSGIGEVLDVETMLPAVAQGAIGIEHRTGDEAVAALLAPLHDPATAAAVTAERALLAALDGSCRTPIGGLARLEGGRLLLDGLVVSPDGAVLHRLSGEGTPESAEAVGAELGLRLRELAGPGFFDLPSPDLPAR